MCVRVHMHVGVYIHVTHAHTSLWKLPDFTDTTPGTGGNLCVVMTADQDPTAACFEPSLNTAWKINPAVNALATSVHLSLTCCFVLWQEGSKDQTMHIQTELSVSECAMKQNEGEE